MSEIRLRRELPAEWFVPDYWVASFPRGKQAACRLVDNGLWKRLHGGYGLARLRESNTPDAVRKLRKSDREKPSRQRSRWGRPMAADTLSTDANHGLWDMGTHLSSYITHRASGIPGVNPNGIPG